MIAMAELDQQTYLPEKRDAESLASVQSFLVAHEDRRGETPAPRYLLVGANEGDQVELPAELHRILRQVVDALTQGRAVSIAPTGVNLTTQQAADMLGVSRPTLIKLLEQGEIPFERPAGRRHVKLKDVLEYRKRRRVEQYEALRELAIGLEEEDDPVKALEAARKARKRVAEARRVRAAGSS